MTKLVQNDIASLTNEQSALAALNSNYASLEVWSDSVLSRDGTSPNQMEADLDMNSNQILNLPAPTDPNDPVRLQDLNTVLGGGTIKAFPETVPFVTLATSTDLTNERVLTAGTNIGLTDGGAGSTITVGINGADLNAIEAVGTTGIATRTAANTWTTRSLTQPSAGITISNNDGVSGNPTFALADDLAAIEGLSTTGLISRTNTSTFAARTLQQPAAGISIAQAGGVGGDPTFSLANDLQALEALSSNGFAERTGTDTWVSTGFTGTGNVVRQTSPSLTTPQLGTPASGVLSNCTGLPFASGLTENALGFRNRLINPSGLIWQRENSGSAAITDATYAFDRWYGLTQTAGVTASQLTDQESGTPYMFRLLQANAVAQRFGIAQVIEGKNCKDLRGKNVTLSGRVRMNTTTTLRYAILEWTGTEDSVTKDVVLDWTNGTFTAGNFFSGTSLTIRQTGSIALTANTLTTLTGAGVTLGTTFTNLIVFFWTDSTQAQNVVIDLGRMQLEEGTSPSPPAVRPVNLELILCQRYYEIISAASASLIAYGVAQLASTTRGVVSLPFKTQKRVAPTVTLSANSDWAFYNSTISGLQAWTSASMTTTEYGCIIDASVAAGLSGAGGASLMSANSTTNARVRIDAEI